MLGNTSIFLVVVVEARCLVNTVVRCHIEGSLKLLECVLSEGMCILVRVQHQGHVLESLDTIHALGLLQTGNQLLVTRAQRPIHHSYCFDDLFICITSQIVLSISPCLYFIEIAIIELWGSIGCTSACTSRLLKETFLLAPQPIILLFFNTTQIVLVPLLLV